MNSPARLKPKLKFLKQSPSNVIDTKSSKMYLTADRRQNGIEVVMESAND